MDWLMKILGMQQNGQGGNLAPFGALGGGGTGPTGPAAPGAGGINNGMPMSGVGPGAPAPAGAPLNLSPATAPTSPGLLGSLVQKFGGAGQPGGAPAQGSPTSGQQTAMNTALGLIKQPQLQPAPWMQMMPMGTMRG